MDMDFDLSESVSRIAVRHARKGTPIEKAWPEVVAAARRGIGASLAKTALELPITASLVQVAATYAALLARDRPGKAVKGLWFGLVELSMDDSLKNTTITPYLAGSPTFDPKSEDWPCGPTWMPKDCYAMNPAMLTLSKLRKRAGDRAWFIETALIEPLNTLFCGCIVHGMLPDLLLTGAPKRGIGCGYDSGDLRTLGVLDANGFKPISAR